jgi:hypothetical protein
LQPQKLAIQEKPEPLANSGFLNHEGHEEQKNLCVLRDLRGSSFYGIAKG